MARTAKVDSQDQLILLSAGTAARRLALRGLATRLMADVDWARLAVGLRSRKLLPALGPRIVELGGEATDDGFRVAVEDSVLAGRRHGAFLQLMSSRVLSLLGEAGIRASALKGPLLAEAIYGDPGRRLSGDVDLLVPPEHLSEAVDLVRTMGYDAPTDYVDASGLPLLHFVLLHGAGELPAVELHWRVHWYERLFAAEQLVPPEVEPLGSWRPAPAAELIGLLLFYARDGFAGLRMASDLSGWWDAYGSDLPPEVVPDLLREYPELTRVTVAAAHAAEAVVGIPASNVLGGRVATDRRERIAVRLANPSPRASEPQLYAEMGLVDGLLTPPGGFRGFVGRQLLPPSDVLDEHSRQASRSRARSPAVRCAGTLARYVGTIPRLIRPPERLP